MTVSTRGRFRRCSHVVLHWRNRQLVVVNYGTGGTVAVNTVVMHVLALCSRWTTATELARRLPGFSLLRMQRLIDVMVRHRLLVTEADGPSQIDTALDAWSDWNPAAGLFHMSTKNVAPPRDYVAAERQLQITRRNVRLPAPFKRYANTAVTELPPGSRDGDFPGVLLRRRTWRAFGARPVSLAEISTLLQLTWGVQRTERSAAGGRVHLKTSPSSGARQPIEAYVLARRVEGLAAGLYHYRPDSHGLEVVRLGASARDISRYIPGQPWYRSAGAVFMMTAVFERTRWRYPYARAYRSVLLEAGHICQTFCLVATWLGLAPFCTGRFSDKDVERDLGIDGVSESFVYGAGVGSRPPNTEWMPWPPALLKKFRGRPGVRRRSAGIPDE